MINYIIGSLSLIMAGISLAGSVFAYWTGGDGSKAEYCCIGYLIVAAICFK